jgi:ketosteroid isomerase-like protein
MYRRKLILVGTALIVGIFCHIEAEARNLEDEIKLALQAQAEAWNRGDLAGFMSGYLKSPETSYISGSTEVWGYDALRDRYEKRYGSSRETMGTLDFSQLKVVKLDEKSVLCIGHWHLKRQNEPDIGGIYSLVLSNSRNGWKIIHDHTTQL